MTRSTDTVFRLPGDLVDKADPALIRADEQHFAAIATTLARTSRDLTDRLTATRRRPGGSGTEAFERDQEIHRLTSRLRTLDRFGLDLCLGRMVPDDGGAPVYVGRLGLTAPGGRRLLVDWRSPDAEPFFGATHRRPMGLTSRRRYRWVRGHVVDYWDEVFTPDGLEGHAALDDQSAFIASLATSRSPRMRDVLGTIQADQDAILRAGADGALVVDGGPGTGKTVVALHRTAYLLYSDPRLGHRRGGVLFVGPHQPYLDHVSDVLPSLGEEGVRTCTMRDLVAEGAGAVAESDPVVNRLKSTARMVDAIEPAIALYEEPPTEGFLVESAEADVWLTPQDWSEAFDAADPGTPHNEARELVWQALLDIVVDKLRASSLDESDADLDDLDTWEDQPPDDLRRALAANRELALAFNRAWPLLEAADVVGDLWSAPAYLRRSAPWLRPEEVAALQRPEPRAWTEADLPLLDAARRRLGDPHAARRRRRREAAVATERTRMSEVVDHLIASDDSDLGVMSMLRGEDLRTALDDDGVAPGDTTDSLAGPFAHIVVDEAQEVTDAQWQMLLQRCPSRSFTVVGDRAQARHGFAESWQERLERVGLQRIEHAVLTINYRTPAEVMAAAEPVIRAALPDANVPTSVRSTGRPVRTGSTADLTSILEEWLAAHPEGTACVVGAPDLLATDRVSSLGPELVKGLEFDLVVLVDPESFGAGLQGAVDRYVAMTRATRELVVLS